MVPYESSILSQPIPVLGNLDLNRSLVWDPYSETWTRIWEPILVYVLESWLNIGDPYGMYNFGNRMYDKCGDVSDESDCGRKSNQILEKRPNFG